VNSNSKQGLGLCVLLVVGCGAPEDRREAGVPGAGASMADAGEGAVDAGQPTADAGLTVADAGVRKLGFVSLVQQRLVIPGLEPLWANAASAAFFDPVGCTVSRAGGCELTECPTGTAQLPQRSAGTLTFGGLVDGGVQVEFAMGTYSAQLPGQAFSFGTTLTVTASGGDVPAFSASVTAPEGTMLTTPVCPNSTCGAVSRSQPLEVTWTAPTFGSAVVELGAANGQIRCVVSASSRRATIPVALLAKLPAGQGVLTVGGASATTVPAGDWDVTFTARDTAFGLVDLQP